MSVSEDVTITIVFAFASFLATLGMVVTGFGHALIFIAAYTIASITGFLRCEYCGIKNSIFLQGTSLAAIMPFMLWGSREIIKKNANKKLLLAFIPATIIGTPVGNVLQKVVRADLIQIIVGSLVVLFCCFQVIRLRKLRKKKGSLVVVDTDGVLPKREESKVVDMENENEDAESFLAMRNDAKVETSTADANDEILEGLPEDCSAEDSSPKTPTGIKFWILSFVLGWFAGFIGALTGIRSGPILMFFLHYQYSKDEIRSNMMIVTATNCYMRLIFYIFDTLQNQDDENEESSSAWFESEIWYLYLSLILGGIFAIPAGLWAAKKVTEGAFDAIVVIGLLITGVMNITKGSLEITAT